MTNSSLVHYDATMKSTVKATDNPDDAAPLRIQFFDDNGNVIDIMK
jgi:hypothetical protein